MKKAHLLLLGLLLLPLALVLRSSPAVGQMNTMTYLPITFHNHYDIDITQMIVTQATQTNTNAVPLVRNRPTLVRVFVTSTESSVPNEVTVNLVAKRNGVAFGSMTSTLSPAPLNPSRDSLNSTFNFMLPDGWRTGTVELVATAFGGNRDTRTNPLSQTAVFNAVPDLDVKIIPLNYTHQGPTDPGVYFDGNIDNISDYLYRTYPVANVDISFRSRAYNYTGNLEFSGNINVTGAAWVGLLEEIATVKQLENSPSSQVYYLNIPISNGSNRWFFGGIAGIGYIGGSRTSLGIDFGANDQTGELAAHEIGHNFRRQHTPCGNPAGVDPNYPYSEARLGVHGFDIVQNVLYLPQSSRRDVMSYCEPQWVSDYTYTAFYNDQRANGRSAEQANEVLLVRVQFVDGQAEFLPMYRYEGLISAETSNTSHQLQFLNNAGEIVATRNTELLIAEEELVSGESIVTAVLPIDEPYSRVQLVVDGAVLTSVDVAPAGRSAATIERDGDMIRVSWADADKPHVVRLANGDGTYTVVGLDVVGGTFTFEAGDVRNFDAVEVISAD